MNDKSIGIMQAYFFPYIGYFQLIDSVDVFVLYEHVSFRKKTWITRNRILEKGSGKPVHINIPVLGKSSNKLINDISIDNSVNWRKKLLDAVYFNYKKANYFTEIYSFLEGVILIQTDSLHEYNARTIIKIAELLGISTPVIFDNSKDFLLEEKLHTDFNTSKEKIKSERIIRLCKEHKSNTYVNSIGGVELYKKDFFKEKDIELFFIKTENYKYNQFDKEFIPHLSIIDMLMYMGVERTKNIIKQYKLI